MVSLFNALLSVHHFFLSSLYVFVGLFTFRLVSISRMRTACLYYGIIGFISLCMAVAGGSVQNDAYKRFYRFEEFERNGLLEDAKNNPKQFDGMFQIDLQQFKDSAAFKQYLEQHDVGVDRAEAFSMGLFFALLAEISLIFSVALQWVWRRIKSI